MKLSLSSTIFIQSSCFKPIHFDLLPNKTKECDEATLDPFVLHILMTYNDERNFSLAQGIMLPSCVCTNTPSSQFA